LLSHGKQWLCERGSMLRNAYIACLVRNYLPDIWKERMELAKSKVAFKAGMEICAM
jgi:hypothetical protein